MLQGMFIAFVYKNDMRSRLVYVKFSLVKS